MSQTEGTSFQCCVLQYDSVNPAKFSRLEQGGQKKSFKCNKRQNDSMTSNAWSRLCYCQQCVETDSAMTSICTELDSTMTSIARSPTPQWSAVHGMGLRYDQHCPESDSAMFSNVRSWTPLWPAIYKVRLRKDQQCTEWDSAMTSNARSRTPKWSAMQWMGLRYD